MQSQQHNVKQFHRCGILQKVTRLEANSDAACCQDSDQELNTMVLGGLHPKLGLTQELSLSLELVSPLQVTPCVGSFTSPGIDTR